MDLVRLCPFTTATLLWEVAPAEWSLTVCVKATFKLLHGREAVLHEDQDPLEGDRHWGDDPEASLWYAADLVPLKRRADVLLVGHAYAAAPTASLVASLQVGDLVKTVQVAGNVTWVDGETGLELGEPRAFTEMPLTYERAPLGPDNPVGIDRAARPMEGSPARPNLSGAFGPIDPTWRGRQGSMSLASVDWAYEITTGHGSAGPPPHGFDFAFFNAAPPDQQLDLLRPSAPIVLENLHAEHALFETRLPALRPKIFWADPSAKAPREIALRCDTLWIDADSSIAAVVWRGVTAVAGPDESAIGRILAVAEAPGRRLDTERVAELLRATDPYSIPIEELLGRGGHHPLDVRHDGLKTADRRAPPGKPAGSAQRSTTADVRGAVAISPLPFRPDGVPSSAASAEAVARPARKRKPGEDQTHDVALEAVLRPVTPFEGVPAVTQEQPTPPEPEPRPPAERRPDADSLEAWAGLAAELDARSAERDAVLREHDLDETTCAALEKRWSDALAEEAERGDTDLQAAYDLAYVTAQERFRPPIGVAEYARVALGVERGETGRVLGELHLALPDVVRLQRVWTRRMARDPEVAEAVAKAIEAERARTPGS